MKWGLIISSIIQAIVSLVKSIKSPSKVKFDKEKAKKDIKELEDSKY